MLLISGTDHYEEVFLVYLRFITSFVFITGCKGDGKEILERQTLKTFSLAFIKDYKSLVEKNISPTEYRKYFELYKSPNFAYNLVLSTVNGASVEFFPSTTQRFAFTETEKLIEDYTFKNINLKATVVPGQDIKHVAIVNKIGLKSTMFAFQGGYNYWHGNEVITNDGSFFEMTSENTGIFFKNILVDKVFFPNYLLIKSSNKKKHWTTEEAVKWSHLIFESESLSAYINSEEFRKFRLSPILSQLANEIAKKESEGIYGKEMAGALEFEKDLMELRQMALQNSIPIEFTDIMLTIQRNYLNRKGWYERHPIYTGLIVSLIIFIRFCFRIM